MVEEKRYWTGKALYSKGDVLIARIQVREVVESEERGIEYVVEDVGSDQMFYGRVPEKDVLKKAEEQEGVSDVHIP